VAAKCSCVCVMLILQVKSLLCGTDWMLVHSVNSVDIAFMLTLVMFM